jgi:hypothetical protein
MSTLEGEAVRQVDHVSNGLATGELAKLKLRKPGASVPSDHNPSLARHPPSLNATCLTKTNTLNSELW